ncbi:MAG: cation:proton antiporter [Chloroherpetonaceae bacterium]|nr:cation:proton antiporter [Chloroherpetonaceae bacterium]
MHDFHFLQDLVIISALAVVVVLIFQKIKLPPVIGLIVTGIMVGNTGLKIVSDVTLISTLAELGVVLLLFAIGLEFSVEDFKKLKNIVLFGGAFQVILTVIGIGILAFWLLPLFGVESNWRTSVFLGMALALSSTAICLKLLDDRGELNQPHGKIALGILIFQDIAVVPMMIGINLLNPSSETSFTGLMKELGLLVVFAIAIIGGFRFFMPYFAKIVSALHAKEIAVLGALLLCFGSAYLTSLAGLSLALGAFIAGVIISSTDESHQISETLTPFRDALTSIFFVSVGLLLDIKVINLPLYVVLSLVVLIINATLATTVGVLLGFPLRIALIAGIALAQVGEFSFVLAELGLKNEVINPEIFQGTLAVIVITMIVTPALIAVAPRVAERLAPALEFIPLRKDGSHPEADKIASLQYDEFAPNQDAAEIKPHVVVVGYGESGRNISAVLMATNVRHVVLEKSRKQVETARKEGFKNIFIGEAKDIQRLSQLGADKADAIAICISGLKESAECISAIRELNPNSFIIVRTRQMSDVPLLYKAGASSVITEKFESSIQIFSLLLKQFDISAITILEQQEILRREFFKVIPDEKQAEEKTQQTS